MRPSRIRPSCAVLCGALTVVAAASDAQTPTNTFVDRIDVEVVNVEVFVTDRAGRPVTGLTAEDFQISEDGQPVPITNFYVVESAATETPTGAAPGTGSTLVMPGLRPVPIPEERPLHLLVYVDNFNLLPGHRLPVLESLGVSHASLTGSLTDATKTFFGISPRLFPATLAGSRGSARGGSLTDSLKGSLIGGAKVSSLTPLGA